MIVWLSLGVTVGGCSRFDAEPVPVRFEIAGAHAALNCETCHTEGRPFQPLSTDCRSCHEQDRKSPTHYADQSCDDAGCHSNAHLLWADALGEGGGHDFLPLEGAHDLDCEACHTDLENHADLPGVSAYCWNCHEADRRPEDLDTPNGLHYIAYLGGDPKQPDPAFRWDCGPCHTPVDWSSAFDHEPRSPHGVMLRDAIDICVLQPDETDWITGCDGCHPDSTAQSQCVSCHDDPGHFPGTAPLTCINAGCHVSAQPQHCDGRNPPGNP